MMQKNPTSIFQITNTTLQDLNIIYWLFDEATKLQNKNGYKVWESIDKEALQDDIKNILQFKVVRDEDILGIFSIQFNDPFIWRERDQKDAIYLHRIVVNPNFKGQKLFEKVLTWAIQLAKQENQKFLRMDTWADNYQLIEYYKSYGFQFIENYKTPDIQELPIQNRNLDVALLEMTVN
jgi:ribosomal protein S18 acetylase RimI-like enzyme